MSISVSVSSALQIIKGNNKNISWHIEKANIKNDVKMSIIMLKTNIETDM